MSNRTRGTRFSQFSIRTLLIAMIAVAAYFGGRLSMRDEIEQLNTKVDKLNLEIKTGKLDQVKAWPAPFKANSNTVFVPLGTQNRIVPGTSYAIYGSGLNKIPLSELERGIKANELLKPDTNASEQIERGMKASELEYKNRLRR